MSKKKIEISGNFHHIEPRFNALGSKLFEMSNFQIVKVLYNDPATIVFWSDGTKTVCKTQGGDVYNAEMGLVMCVLKKIITPTQVRDILEDWIPTEGNVVTLANVRRNKKCKSKE